MIKTLIILTSISQIGLYLISDKMDFKYGRILIFLMILIGHLFVFPSFFYPEPDPNGMNCGMPVLGITLVFWIIGGGTVILVHTVYHFIRKLVKIKSEEPTFSEILDYQVSRAQIETRKAQ